ncbi:hypothetical protein JOQ06_011699 [Pogonophryne albipinna]|uniref:SRCR domain-containing protein n=1 Tax=Pogonophryne albipinna TaxID=1090488 RepID=A0AAD6FNG1_9TELE|nr:hypothetical protein JOQ06_011699 [Pogonophryne albipinna]
MDHLLLLMMLLVCSSGLQAEGELNSTEPGVRLVGGESRCAGDVEVEHEGEWRPVEGYDSPWTLKTAAVACRELDCGSAVSVGRREESSLRDVWGISPDCVESGSALRECAGSASSSSSFLTLTCSDSVRLLEGTGLCSGRLEVNSDPSDPSWSSVCEADFDQQDAQVVCRQLGCGAPSVLRGALYGEGEAPMGTKEFQCGGHESALLDCSSASERNTCSPGTAVSLTCSEPGVQLVGGESRCAGDLVVEHEGEWRQVEGYSFWTLKTAGVLCRELDCGSAVSVGQRYESSGRQRPLWWIRPDCVESGSALRECAAPGSTSYFLNLTCSGVSGQEEEEEMKRPGGSGQEEEEEMKRPGGSEQEEEEEMKRPGGSEQEEEEEMKRPGGSGQEEEEEMKRPGGSEQEEEEEMKRPGGSGQEEEEEMKRPGG